MKLQAPPGVGAVSFGGRSYPVVKGVVEVPDEATVFLEPGYGFCQVVEPAETAGGTPALQKTESHKPKTGT